MFENTKKVIEDILTRRFFNPVFSTFFVTSGLLHWGFIYSLIALDQEYIWKKYRLLKNEYLFEIYVCSGWFWVSFLLAGFITYLLIWHAPRYILLPADKEDNKYRRDKEIERLNMERDIKESQKNVVVIEREIAQEEEKKTSSEIATAEAIKKAKEADSFMEWEKDYKKFSKSPDFYKEFNWIIKSVYRHGGNISWYKPDSTERVRIPPGILAFVDVNDLVKITKDNISLTSKGKFFVNKYTQENPT